MDRWVLNFFKRRKLMQKGLTVRGREPWICRVSWVFLRLGE